MMNLILSGGIGKTQDTSMVPYYANLIPPGAKILYLPIAKRTRPFSESYERMCANLIRLGVKADITFWTDLTNKHFEDLDSFDSLYIEGGNPFILLDALKRSDSIDALRSYIQSGRLVYGQSAGALIMGADISLAKFLSGDVENTVGLLDTKGLDLFHGYSLWPHYTSKDDALIQSLVTGQGFKILAIPEYTGIYFTTKGNKVCGASAVTVFKSLSKKIYPSGTSVTF